MMLVECLALALPKKINMYLHWKVVDVIKDKLYDVILWATRSNANKFFSLNIFYGRIEALTIDEIMELTCDGIIIL